MKFLTGTVMGGKIEVPAEALDEGTRVAILSPGPEWPEQLTAAEEDELAAALEQIRRGEYLDGDDLLRELRSQRLG